MGYLAPEVVQAVMPPESESEDSPILLDAHPSQDMWSFGVTAFAMLCGRPIVDQLLPDKDTLQAEKY